MRILPSARVVAAVLAVVAVLSAGCAGTPRRPALEPPLPCEPVSNGTPVPRPPRAGPDSAIGYRTDMTAVHTATYAVVTANPLATQAACRILRDGGTAADALVAAEAVLGLVEPQSSGLGGGGFVLYYDAATGAVAAYDGRETAPAAADENYLRWISPTDRTPPRPDPPASGRSVGVPGTVRLLAEVHAEHGVRDWGELFDPAVRLAENGFDIGPRLAAAIAAAGDRLRADPAAAAYFFGPDGTPKRAGTRVTNPAYARTLSAIAAGGPDAFYTGAIAADIVAAVTDPGRPRTPGRMTPADLAGYRVIKREPVCTGYRGRQVCGMPPPSSGGLAVAQTLGMLERFALAEHGPADVDRNGGRPSVRGVHLIAEAERLAYADRDRYVADPDFVPLPGGGPAALLDPRYLAERSALISERHTMPDAPPGDFGVPAGAAPPVPEHGTSHISIVDSWGNAAAMTTGIEAPFGSYHMVDGFLLNNQLSDFAADPVDAEGRAVANRVQGGKRPRSTMAPTLVFDSGPSGRRGPLYAVLGSPGGAMIVQFVVKTLVGIVDWGLDPQQAVSAVDFGGGVGPVLRVGGEHPAIDTADDGAHDPLVRGLRALGHRVDLADQSSGLGALVRDPDGGWLGGADPRRGGLVMGDIT